MTPTSNPIARQPITARDDAPESEARHMERPAAATGSRRFGWATIGFALGGLMSGTGGCILGARMAYAHPVAVAISILWWGVYLGCFGASIGGLFGLWADSPSSLTPAEAAAASGRGRSGRRRGHSGGESWTWEDGGAGATRAPGGNVRRPAAGADVVAGNRE